MSGRIRNYKGWQLVNTTKGWYVERGDERMRVAPSWREHDEELDRRIREAVDRREDDGR